MSYDIEDYYKPLNQRTRPTDEELNAEIKKKLNI